jgi:hypothetical protein
MLVLIVALTCGLIAGYALGGRLRNIEHLSLRLTWLVVLAMAVQLVIFTPLGAPLSETIVLAAHMASYALLLAFAVANRHQVGVALVGVGTLLNAAVIFANGGYMPASRWALEFAGIAVAAEPHNNSTVAGEGARLLPLGDVMASPSWVPVVGNVFSVGDVLVAAGVAMLLVTAMRGPAGAMAATPTTGGQTETP